MLYKAHLRCASTPAAAVMAGAEAGVVVAAGQEGKLACTQIPECPTPSAEYS